jgi:hypothetical protein
MKLNRCPVCHNHLNLEAIAQDEAGKELMALIAKLSPATATSCLSYIGLFRPAKSDLNNGRALRLLTDVLSLTSNQSALCQALDQTTTQLQQSRAQNSDAKPLGNNNYLKKVLTSIHGWNTQTTTSTSHEITTRPAKTSKQSIDDTILDIHSTDWATGLSHE